MLLQFLVERGVKAVVFISEDSLEGLLTLFQKIPKLVNVEGLLLYIVSLNAEGNTKGFQEYKKGIEMVLKASGIHAKEIVAANPS